MSRIHPMSTATAEVELFIEIEPDVTDVYVYKTLSVQYQFNFETPGEIELDTVWLGTVDVTDAMSDDDLDKIASVILRNES